MGRWAEPQRVNEALRAQPYSCAILAGYEPSESDRSRLQIDQTRTVQGRVKAHFSIAEHEEFIRKAVEIRATPV